MAGVPRLPAGRVTPGPRMPLRVAALVATCAVCRCGPDGPGAHGRGLYERPSNTTCLAPPRPTQTVALVPAFPALTFAQPVQMEATRDGAWWFLAERAGRLWRFSTDPAKAEPALVLDLTVEVDSSESGLLGLALHPDFAANGDIFLSFTAHGGAFGISRVWRFHSADGGATFDEAPSAALLELEQITRLHHNADLKFGPDGYLYVGFGDGGPHGDPEGRAQNPDDLKGKILRLDVDGSPPYAIPADNPFADGGGAPEVYALGLRNPWRFNFDRVTGDLWAGDVGWWNWEELDRIVAGGNYGWNLREGTHCVGAEPCDLPGSIDPVVEYGHDEGHSITAGYVYRGGDIPALVGRMIYADFVNGYIWSIDPDEAAPRPQVISADGQNVVSFAEDVAGELYLVDLYAGTLSRMVAGAPGPDDVPTRLSQTGCFGPAGEPAAGLVPYDLIVPFWSDGAAKRRWMALPDGGTIDVTADHDLLFPVGSVLVKEFELDGQPVETRLLVRHEDGEWAGYTYAWDAQQNDATLLPHTSATTVVEWPVTGSGDHEWTYPRRTECLLCHNPAAGRTLGLELSQLDREVSYPSDRTADQLATLERIGMFSGPLPVRRTVLPATDGDAALGDRARAWLHTNCAYCHRPGGPGQGEIDLRFTTPLTAMNVCEARPEDDLGIEDARLLVPGAPERSILSVRIQGDGRVRMPPLATAIVDDDGVALVDGWIASLAACD